MMNALRSNAAYLTMCIWAKIAMIYCAMLPLAQGSGWPLLSPEGAAFHLVAVFSLGVWRVTVSMRGPEWRSKGYPSILQEMPKGWLRVGLWGLLTMIAAPFWVLLGGAGEWPAVLYWIFLANCAAAAAVGLSADVLWMNILKERASE